MQYKSSKPAEHCLANMSSADLESGYGQDSPRFPDDIFNTHTLAGTWVEGGVPSATMFHFLPQTLPRILPQLFKVT